jgi:hypothetical protein
VAVAEISAEAVGDGEEAGSAEGETSGHGRADKGEGTPMASAVCNGVGEGEGLPQNVNPKISSPIGIRRTIPPPLFSVLKPAAN